jgi:hypothetical protein
MPDLTKTIAKIDWPRVAADMHARGYARVPRVLSAAECRRLIAGYDTPGKYRKTITMERYRFGLGEYKYFDYPLPPILQTIRELVYPKLAPIANQWMEWLGLERRYPATFAELRAQCARRGQDKPTVLILRYGPGGHNTLHQDLYGEIFFPIQLVLFLNDPEHDYTGGEFVLVEQTPRAQSKVIVLQPKRGDVLLFTTNFRPVKGARGYYRAAIRHGVSEVRNGERHTLGIIFHDALT